MTLEHIFNILEIVLKVSLVLFMVGNLFGMGLRLNLSQAMVALGNWRFIGQSLLWGFVICPAVVVLLARVIPMAAPYGTGLVLLGMAPCAPFLPPMVDRARGDLAHTAAFMLLMSVVTVIYMPLMVPLTVHGLSASAWTIAKPLLFFILLPLAVGLAVQMRSSVTASRLHPIVKKATDIDTIVMLLLCVVIYAKGFVAAVGSLAIGAQIIFFSVATLGPYFLSWGLPQNQKSVLALGMATRNLGAALAPLFAVADVDQRAIIMVALGVLMQAAASFAGATWFGRLAVSGAAVVPRGSALTDLTSQPASAESVHSM